MQKVRYMKGLWRGPTQRCPSALLRDPDPSPGVISLGPIKSTTATLSVRKRQIMLETPTNYCHPTGVVGDGRIFIRSNRLPVLGYFDVDE